MSTQNGKIFDFFYDAAVPAPYDGDMQTSPQTHQKARGRPRLAVRRVTVSTRIDPADAATLASYGVPVSAVLRHLVQTAQHPLQFPRQPAGGGA